MFSLTEENYLKTIYHLEQQIDGGVNTTSIAEKLETKPSSVTDMVQKLAEKNLLLYKKYKGAQLTASGKRIAASVIRKHRLWEVFLVEKLNFQWDEVHEIAEQLEHIQSEELVARLDVYLGIPDFDPHGDPIPDADGKIKDMNTKLLSECEKEQNVVCVGVKESSSEFLQFLNKMNVSIGTKIKIINKESFDGSMVIEVMNNQFFISKKTSENIFINLS